MKRKGKAGLKVREVQRGHFSSGVRIKDPVNDSYSKISLTLLEASSLLASDVETGKSDPVAFAWCGYKDSKGEPTGLQWDSFAAENSGILSTKTCYATCDPVWNEEVIFPIQIANLESLIDLNCIILIRDEDRSDSNPAEVTYENLGEIEIPVSEIISLGKPLKSNSIIMPVQRFPLRRSTGMRRVDGAIKIKASIILSNADIIFLSDYIKETVAVPESSEFKLVDELNKNFIKTLQMIVKTGFKEAPHLDQTNNTLLSETGNLTTQDFRSPSSTNFLSSDPFTNASNGKMMHSLRSRSPSSTRNSRTPSPSVTLRRPVTANFTSHIDSPARIRTASLTRSADFSTPQILGFFP
jgi:hypothetical protein